MAVTKKAITLAMNLAYEAGKEPHSAGNDMNIPRRSILQTRVITQELKGPKVSP
jgi:hypothetical protein